MKKIFIYAISFIGLSINAFAQEESGKEKKGDEYYFIYAYNKAIDEYTHTKNLSIEGHRKLAKSYQNENKDSLAEITYAKLISLPGGGLPEDYYDYAMILKDNCKYQESNKYMDKFSKLKPTDLRAKDYLANKAELPDLLKDDSKYAIMHLDINNDAQDFGPVYYKNKIVFTSSRETPKLIQRTSNRNGKPDLNLFIADVENGQMKNPVVFSEKFVDKLNTGTASFSNDSAYIAYTQNNEQLTKQDRVVSLEIYFRRYKDGKWSEPEAFFLNSKDYSVGHPSLTADGNTMYFTSDMPGGYGGTDIYKIKKDEKGIWGKPENLGNKLNTEGDEMFPFFEEKNGVLFFASDGRFGLGGLDIYICWFNNSNIDRIYNMGAPLNTQYDDFAMITNDRLSKGYFSSNRVGGSGDDDIYAVDIAKLKGLEINKQIKGIVKDTAGNAIPNTFITLFSDSNKVLDSLTTKYDGAYTFLVKSDKTYKLLGKKEKYLDGDTIVNTSGKELIVKADLILHAKRDTTKKMEVGDDIGQILRLDQSILNQPIYFDFDKYNLRPDAVTELTKIVEVMNEYPNIVVELRSYTDCRGTEQYNQVLSDKRAKVSAWFIKARITKPERIYGKGYGETNLVNRCACEGDVVSDCTEDEHQKNRRTEFIITKKFLAKE